MAVLGLAFKANTDDIRFSPALEVVKRLIREGADVHATDPEAISRAKAAVPKQRIMRILTMRFAMRMRRLSAQSGTLFAILIGNARGELMARKLVVDGRNLYSPAHMREMGFEYLSFGRE